MSKGDLRKPFYHLVGDQLTNLVEQHFKLVLSNVKESMRLGELDSQGIDVLHFDEDDGAVVTAIQCKGIEGQFKPSHTKKFIDEIDKFEAKAPPVKEYRLVINAAISDPQHLQPGLPVRALKIDTLKRGSPSSCPHFSRHEGATQRPARSYRGHR